jgi:hypothetical protein
VRLTALLVWAGLTLAVAASAQPRVANPGFEQDRFTVWPGYLRHNGGGIAGWQGGSGVNPIWNHPETQKGPEAPFCDNGKIPEGKQLAFIQGPGRLSQRVSGFEAGRTYRVLFRENARVHRPAPEAAWPRVQVTLGGKVIVSPHEVRPVSRRDDFTAPFVRVESASFTAAADGAYELVFETLHKESSTVLLDDVSVQEVTVP